MCLYRDQGFISLYFHRKPVNQFNYCIYAHFCLTPIESTFDIKLLMLQSYGLLIETLPPRGKRKTPMTQEAQKKLQGMRTSLNLQGIRSSER